MHDFGPTPQRCIFVVIKAYTLIDILCKNGISSPQVKVALAVVVPEGSLFCSGS